MPQNIPFSFCHLDIRKPSAKAETPQIKAVSGNRCSYEKLIFEIKNAATAKSKDTVNRQIIRQNIDRKINFNISDLLTAKLRNKKTPPTDTLHCIR